MLSRYRGDSGNSAEGRESIGLRWIGGVVTIQGGWICIPGKSR